MTENAIELACMMAASPAPRAIHVGTIPEREGERCHPGWALSRAKFPRATVLQARRHRRRQHDSASVSRNLRCHGLAALETALPADVRAVSAPAALEYSHNFGRRKRTCLGIRSAPALPGTLRLGVVFRWLCRFKGRFASCHPPLMP